MIGINTVIINRETANSIFQKYFMDHLFKDGDFKVSGINKKYNDWEITLEGKEASDATES